MCNLLLFLDGEFIALFLDGEFITLFWLVNNYVSPFTSHGTLHEFGAEKPIS